MITPVILKRIQKFLFSEIFLHSFKTALACLIGIEICAIFNVYNTLWLVLTILVVMGSQTHFGGAVQKSYARVIGTLIGATIAGVTLATIGQNHYSNLIIIFMTVWWFSYVANSRSTIRDAGILGAITTVTILLSPNATLKYAVLRLLEILLGIIIALIVSKLVFPIHARTHLLNNFSDVFDEFIKIFNLSFDSIKNSEKQAQLQKIEEKVVRLIASQSSLILDAKNEISSIPYNKAIAENISSYQQKLFRSLIFLYQACNKEPDKFNLIIQTPKLKAFGQQVINSINGLSNSLSDKKFLPKLDTLEQAVADLEKACVKLDEKTKEELGLQLNTLLFCARHINDEIHVLQMTIGTYRTIKE